MYCARRAQYTAIHNYRTSRASREGKQATGDQSSGQANVEIRLVLTDMFKDDFQDWLPVNDLRVGGEFNDPGASAVINELFNDGPLVFDPEFAK